MSPVTRASKASKGRGAGRAPVRYSDDLPAGHWIKRQLPSGTSLRPYCEDSAVSLIVSLAATAVAEAGMSRADLAARLGTTRSNVSQILNGSRNMTVKTLGAILWACGLQVNGLATRATADDSCEGSGLRATPKKRSSLASAASKRQRKAEKRAVRNG